jgi:hypothetical protein
MGPSRSAGSCQSPHLTIMSMPALGRMGRACWRGRGGIRLPGLRSRAFSREFRRLPRAEGLAPDDAIGLSGRPLHRRAIDARDKVARLDLEQAGAYDDRRQSRAVPAESRQPPVLPTGAELWVSDFTYVAT